LRRGVGYASSPYSRRGYGEVGVVSIKEYRPMMRRYSFMLRSNPLNLSYFVVTGGIGGGS
jgi:hypothetical protein